MEGKTLICGYLAGVRFTRASFCLADATLALTVRSSLADDAAETTVLFEGVTRLKLGDLDAARFMTLTASDIRHWQHERARYSVADCEDEVVSSACMNWRRLDPA